MSDEQKPKEFEQEDEIIQESDLQESTKEETQVDDSKEESQLVEDIVPRNFEEQEEQTEPEPALTQEQESRKQSDFEQESQASYQKRYDALWNDKLAGQQLGLSNTNLYFEQHIKFKYDHHAESKMKELEKQDKENKNEYMKLHYLGHRQREYQKIDGMFREALAEFFAEDRKDKMKEYKEKRLEIKRMYPKPEDE
jgi:hypothetical protein